MTIGYSADALIYDVPGGFWYLRPDYDPALHRVEFAFTDDDAYLHGDVGADEVGSDSNQTAVVTDMSGTPIASGQVYDEEFYAVWDGVNPTVWIERVEIGGVHVGYVVSGPLTPGTNYSESTRSDVDGPPTAPTYASFTDVPCFGRGTRVTTAAGAKPVEWLSAGELVLTRDDGFQPLRWLGRYHLPTTALQADPRLRPVRIDPRSDTGGRGLVVSQQHRILVTGAELELYFGCAEAFCPAKSLGKADPVAVGRGYTYFHLLFDRHQVIFAEGIWSESLFAGSNDDLIAGATGVHPPAEITHARTARLCLSNREARLICPSPAALEAWRVAA